MLYFLPWSEILQKLRTINLLNLLDLLQESNGLYASTLTCKIAWSLFGVIDASLPHKEITGSASHHFILRLCRHSYPT